MVRFKNRYMVIQVETSSPHPQHQSFTTGAVAQHLRNSISTNFGIYGSSLAANSLSVKYCNPNTGTILLRVSRDQASNIWMCITLLTTGPVPISYSPQKEALVVNSEFSWRWTVLHIAGTIKSAQRNTIKIIKKKSSSSSTFDDEKEILLIEH